ncbi:hypothetical protein SERLA73DRAFT_143432, partial [Serpula lacrymans var. lacrymans S7.3]
LDERMIALGIDMVRALHTEIAFQNSSKDCQNVPQIVLNLKREVLLFRKS